MLASSNTITPEHLAKALGKPGKFQFLLYIVLSMNVVYVSWNHLGMAFLGANTKHHCRVENKTDVDHLVPLVNIGGKKQWDGCHLYAGYNTTDMIPCPKGWTYDLTDRESTIVAKWDLVCDDVYKTSLATTLYFCGVMIGSLVFGALSDRFGRRPVFICTMCSPCFIGLFLFFIQNYIAFVILRFFLGFLLEGLFLVSFISFVELLAIQYRTAGGVLQGAFWSFGVMSLALIAYLIQDWQYIQLVCTMATLLQIGMFCFLPESFRWLFTKKRVDEAEQVVRRIATFNKLPFPRDVFDKVAQNSMKTETKVSGPRKNYTILDIFRSSVLRKRCLILAIMWFSSSLGYYGLALNVSSLAGNKYLNFFISGVFELIIGVMTVFILQRFGRRKPLTFYFIIGGITCLSAGILSNEAESESLQIFSASLALTGRIAVSGCFDIIFVYTSELYPTVIRNVGLGTGVFWARIGGVMAPQIILLGNYTASSVPFILCGACVLTSGTLTLLLPETLNKKLAETLEEAGKLEKMSSEIGDREPTKENNIELVASIHKENQNRTENVNDNRL